MFKFTCMLYWTRLLSYFINHEKFLQKVIDNPKGKPNCKVLLEISVKNKNIYKIEELTDKNKNAKGFHFYQGPWGYILKLSDASDYFKSNGFILLSTNDRILGVPPSFVIFENRDFDKNENGKLVTDSWFGKKIELYPYEGVVES